MRWNVPHLILVLVLFPSQALGDGMFVWTNRQIDIVEPEQKALIVFDDGLENLTLQVKFAGAPEEFGWIVPLPSKPRIRAARPDLLESMSKLTQVLRLAHSARTGHLLSGQATSGTVGLESVHLLARDTVGIYDTATLSAEQGDALSNWLDAHEFRGPPGASQVFDHYIRRGWLFVAMRIVTKHADQVTRSSLAEGTIQPVEFQFRTERPVYPLKISSVMPGESEVLLYVVAKQHLDVTSGGGPVWDRQFHGPLTHGGSLFDPSDFPALANRAARLSKLRATFRPEEMEDVVFEPWDQIRALRSESDATRAEAASDIGRLRMAAAVPELIALLNRTRGKDSLCALWALGEIGGEDARKCLLEWGRSVSALHRIEAMESLARLGAKEALPLFLECLERADPPSETDPSVQEERDACLEHLIMLGDESCVPRLRRIALQYEDRKGWESRAFDDVRFGIAAALVACGDASRNAREKRALED